MKHAEKNCVMCFTDAPGMVSPRLVSGIEVGRDLLHFDDALSTEEWKKDSWASKCIMCLEDGEKRASHK